MVVLCFCYVVASMGPINIERSLLFPEIKNSLGIKRWLACEIGYTIALGCLLWLGKVAGIKLLPIFLMLSVLAWVRHQHIWQVRIGIAVLCAGDGAVDIFVYYAWLLSASLLHRIPGSRIERWQLPLVLFVLFGIGSFIAHQFIDPNLLSLPLWLLSFVSPVGVYLYLSRYPLSAMGIKKIVVFIIAMAMFQSMVSYVDYISGAGFRAIWSLQQSPDGVLGTFNSSSSGFSIFLLEAIMILFFLFFVSRRELFGNRYIQTLLLLLLSIFVFTASDKSIEISFVGAFLSFIFLISKFRLRNRAFRWLLYIIIAMILTSPWTYRPVTAKVRSLAIQYVLGDYDWNFGDLNKKASFYINAFSNNRGIMQYLIGYGPGTCGSRAANLRAYDTLYKGPSSQANALKGILPAYSGECTRRFLAPLYNEDYAANASYRSAILGNPFASWPALMLEVGLIGFTLLIWGIARLLLVCRHWFAYIPDIGRVFAATAGITLIAMCVVSLVAQGLENPYLSFFLWFSLAMAHNAKDALCIQSA